ncbi:hypothetical protein [Paracoccus sanguinis]|uniref:hypothetical protein n=1 Tax=Paracoccus sanguinis TaxID=1545044 RepID=UPI0011153C61|nr:hypothetical protein [Paracoccus sanguinis]
MQGDNFISFSESVRMTFAAAKEAAEGLPAAREDVSSDDCLSDTIAEAQFLRIFTEYESAIEKCFLHYVTGGLSLNGHGAHSYLNLTDEGKARLLTKAGYKFLSWAKPSEVRTTSTNYLRDGWPLAPMLASREQMLTNAEKIRNRIAHKSIEATNHFSAVQRDLFGTERAFEISPGQLLRVRVKVAKVHSMVMVHFIRAMDDTFAAMVEPSEALAPI